jgi:hypothetical protein
MPIDDKKVLRSKEVLKTIIAPAMEKIATNPLSGVMRAKGLKGEFLLLIICRFRLNVSVKAGCI